MRSRLSVSVTLVGHRLTLDFFFFFQAAVRSCELQVLRLVDRSFGKSFTAGSSERLKTMMQTRAAVHPLASLPFP
jgi:hypothetical protein